MQKRRLYFTFILGTLSIALGTSVVANEGLLAIGDNSHTAYCQWNHYNRVEPTDDTRGIQEYWVCCTHHDSQLEEPTVGTISNKGNQTQNFINSLESSDIRVIPSYKDQASKVVNLINNIPQTLQGLHGSYISNAINSYELLPSQAKKYVTNYDKLTLASFDYNESYSVLIDASNNEYQTVEYSPTFDYSTGIDQTYGHYASFQNITTVNDHWVWLGKSENISIVNYEEIYLYVYNESASTRDLQFRNPKTWAQIGDYVKVAGQSWTKVNFPLAAVESGLLSNIVIAWYADGQAIGSTFADGFKFSSTIGVRYDTGLSEQSYLDASTKNFDRELDITGRESNVVDGDYSVKIETGKWSSVKGQINFITKETYANVASITFRFKIAGSIPTWWGIGHNTSIANANNYGDYGGAMVNVNTKNTNNAWSSVTLNLNIAEARYYHFIFAVGEYSNTVFIDDFTIKLTSGVTYTDNFNTGTSTLFNTDKAVLSSAVSFNEEKTPIKSIDTTQTDYGMVVDLKEFAIDGQSTLVSYDRFTNVTKISFQYKFIGDTQFRSDSTWLGFAVDDSKNIYSGWSGQMVNPKGNVEADTWYTFEKTISSASGYIYFVAAAGEFSGEDCKVVIDNFAATTAEELISDTFSNAASWYFELGDNCSIGVANSSTVVFNGGTAPGNDDGYAKIDAYNYGYNDGNAATLVTKTKYTNVTQITLKVKIDGAVEIDPNDYWFGISYNTSKPDIYDNIKMERFITTNGVFITKTYNLNITTSNYIAIASNPRKGHFDVLVDDIVIVANGQTYVENFNSSSERLFELGNYVVEYHDETFDLNSVDMHSLLTNAEIFFEGPEFVLDRMHEKNVLLRGTISHEITGSGRYAILIYNDASNADYLLIDNSSISLLHNETLLATLEVPSTTTYDIKLTVDGAVAINNSFMGQCAGVNSTIKFISLFNEGKVVFTDIDLYNQYYKHTTEVINGIEVPIFEGEENIDIAAYAAPTVGGVIADDVMAEFADAGFTKAIALLEGRNNSAIAKFNSLYTTYYNSSDANERAGLKAQMIAVLEEVNDTTDSVASGVLAYAEMHDFKYIAISHIILEIVTREVSSGIVISPNDYEWIFNTVFKGNDDFFHEVNFAGLFIQDEPAVGTSLENQPQLANLFAAVTLYVKYCTRIGIEPEPFVNLLPTYDGAATYTYYIQYYVKYVAPLIGYISVDHYPLWYSHVEKDPLIGSNTVTETYSIEKYHLYNLEIMAKNIRNTGIDLRFVIYGKVTGEYSTSTSSSWGTKTTTTQGRRLISCADELRFQIYSALVYGAKEIIYYQYISEKEDQTGLIDKNTNDPNALHGWAKEVNHEVLSFGKALKPFDWQETLVVQKNSIDQFSVLTEKDTTAGDNTVVSATKNTIVGTFKNSNDQYAFLPMYYADPKNSSDTNSVTFTFGRGYNAIIIYKDGQKTAVRLDGNTYTLSLAVAHGAFIIPVVLA